VNGFGMARHALGAALLTTLALACSDPAHETERAATSPRGQSGDGGTSTAAEDGGHTSPSDASGDGSAPIFTLCEWLARGATFASVDLLWCSTGWPGPDAPPTKASAPDLYCHWTLAFRGSEVVWTQTDYSPSGSFTCSGNKFETMGETGAWDPASGILTFSGDAYRASTGRDGGQATLCAPDAKPSPPANAPQFCVQFCGSDYFAEPVCRDGQWDCPPDFIRGEGCEPTCWGLSPPCCGPNQDTVPAHCEDAGFVCPPGYTPGPCSQ
jgi:hypothetical protein